MHLKRYEKIEIVRTNVLPLFLYIAAKNRMPSRIKKKIKMEVRAFLMGYEQKIDYEKLIQKRELGGLGVIDIPIMAETVFTKPALEFLRNSSGKPESDWDRRLENQLALTLKRYRTCNISNAIPHTLQPLNHWKATNQALQDMGTTKHDIKSKPKDRYSATVVRNNLKKIGDMQGPNWANKKAKLGNHSQDSYRRTKNYCRRERQQRPETALYANCE